MTCQKRRKRFQNFRMITDFSEPGALCTVHCALKQQTNIQDYIKLLIKMWL